MALIVLKRMIMNLRRLQVIQKRIRRRKMKMTIKVVMRRRKTIRSQRVMRRKVRANRKGFSKCSLSLTMVVLSGKVG